MAVTIADKIRIEAAETGGIPFARFMRLALYGDGGYYTEHVSIGKAGGDFYTAAQMPLFGRTIARYCRQVWTKWGRPGTWQVVELGAGQGELAEHLGRALAALTPDSEVRYVLHDVSLHMQNHQQERLSDFAGLKYLWDAPNPALDTIVIANEVLDALPVERLRLTMDGTWEQAWVLPSGDEFELSWRPASHHLAQLAERWLPIEAGQAAELSPEYFTFFERIRSFGGRVIVLCFDYGITREEWANGVRPGGTVRAYAKHRIINELASPGLVDITADAYWDYAEQAATEAGFRPEPILTQGQFLMQYGILEELESTVDKHAYQALAGQLKQLVLPGGMGERFQVMICN